ncbi:MAG: hypothetical protein ACKO38_16865 [Planctomycetota bacterium]
METVSDDVGDAVRGASAKTQASGLSAVAMLFHDNETSTRARLDLVNYGLASDGVRDVGGGGRSTGANSTAENYTTVGIQTPLTVFFPGCLCLNNRGGASGFSIGSVGQAVANGGVQVLALPAPASFRP